jgi:hypothetical protein
VLGNRALLLIVFYGSKVGTVRTDAAARRLRFHPPLLPLFSSYERNEKVALIANRKQYKQWQQRRKRQQ